MSPNRRAIRCALVWSGLALACRAEQDRQPRPSDAYEVYAAALDSFPLTPGQPVRIAAQTWPYSLVRALGDTSSFYRDIAEDEAVGPGLLASYERANQQAADLCDCFPPGRPIELVQYQLRPDVAGPVMLSGIGYDSTRSRALVTVSQACGPLCGTMMMFLVKRTGTGWVVTMRVLTGAS